MPDGEPVPAGRRVTVSLARWLSTARSAGAPPAAAVRVAPGDSADDLAGVAEHVEMIAVEFGAFTEGRGFSQARILRERLGYDGELRAIGAVTRDRLAFMERCGFDAYELAEGEDPQDALCAFDEIPWRYQPGADGVDTVARRRGWRAA